MEVSWECPTVDTIFRRADCYSETNLMIEVMLLGVVFLVGMGALAAAVIIVAMRLVKKKEPSDSTPLS